MATLENTAAPRRDARAGGVLDDETRQQVAELNLQGIEVIQAALVAAGAVVPAAAGPTLPGAAAGGPTCRRTGGRRRSETRQMRSAGGAVGGQPGGSARRVASGGSGRPVAARAGMGRAAGRMSALAGLGVTLAVPGRQRLPDAIEWCGADWLSLDVPARQRLAACPYLLFALDFAGLLGVDVAPPRAVQEARVLPGAPGAAAPFAIPEGRSFARLLLHYAWHLARSSPTVAAFVLGTPLAVVEPLRTLGLARVEALAATASGAVRLRWDHEPMIWMDWLSAARVDEPAALWAAQLRGLQRIAGACRDVAASV